VRDLAIERVRIGLPELKGEQQISWAEAIGKMGVKGCREPCGKVIAPPPALQPVDTSGADDAFNAGYLHARLESAAIQETAIEGHRLAEWIIMRSGAILWRDSL
jgi:2-dehydro-3-deoxygluconokinase